MLATRRLIIKKTYIEDSKGGGDSKKEAIKRFLTNMGHNISKSVLLESSSLRVVAATRSKKKKLLKTSLSITTLPVGNKYLKSPQLKS